jgi:hypothetical protein
MVALRSYWMRFVVMDELAQRVPLRSPALRLTSAASHLPDAMLRSLSATALASSLVIIGRRIVVNGS